MARQNTNLEQMLDRSDRFASGRQDYKIVSGSRSREHFATIAQNFAQSRSFFIKQPLPGGAHGLEQITSLVKTRNVDVVSACIEKLPRLCKHVGSSNDFCSGVQFAQKTNKPRVCCTLKQRIWNSGDEHLGFIHSGMNKCVPVRNVTIDNGHVSLEKAISCDGTEVHHRDFGDQLGIVALELFQQRTGSPEKANEDNACAVIVGRGADCAGVGWHVVEITETKLLQPRNERPPRLSDFAMPKVETTARRVNASATMPRVAGLAR